MEAELCEASAVGVPHDGGTHRRDGRPVDRVVSVIAEKDLGVVSHMEKCCHINVRKQDWLLDDFKY